MYHYEMDNGGRFSTTQRSIIGEYAESFFEFQIFGNPVVLYGGIIAFWLALDI